MSNRESTVAVNIDANVSGKESVADLTKRLDDMAKVLEGDLKNQAQAAADKLRELANQQQAVNTFERLKREATDAAAALKRAESEAENFGQQIGQAGPPTMREAEAMQRLQAATDAARAKMVEQRTALAGAVGELQNYGIASKNTRDAQARLAAEAEQVRASVASLVPAYQGAARGAADAGAQIQRSHRAIGEGVDSISTQLGRVQNAFVALQGGGFLGGLIKDAALTADAYNSLAGRIKLATGEGNAFRAGMEGVQQVAVETRSSLEATAGLFTRLVTAGKELGLTQRDALDLTKTINQAIQVTGGSAQAADAAITQLSQGLQSGVLRGDEFNSVMEQSPRLARALADGLGVGIGKLREMAEQGQLTAETVVKALRGQSEAIASEFNKLPPTVGGALQNLSTAWMVYIGNVDKASGASKSAAEAITYLATHLESIVGTMAEVGKGVLALTLLKLAAHFKDWAIGAAQATVALTANTAATVENTVAARANAVATTAAGAAAATAATQKGVLATAMGVTAAAGRGLLNLIGGPAGLLVLTATYAKDLGELAAKMVLKAQGTKTLEEAERDLAAQQKRAYEQSQAMAAERTRQAQADKDAAEAKFGLSKAAKQLITEFDDLIKKGQSADEAISAIGKKFDLANAPGIAAAAGVLDKLATDGKLSAEQIRKAWAAALDGQDLQRFEVLARTALAGAERSALQLAQVLDATLREAIRRAGLDMDVISGGMSRASVSAINDVETIINAFDKLKERGANASQALAASFVKAIDTSDSQRALEAVALRIEQVRKLLGDKIANGLLEQLADQAETLKRKAEEALPGIQSLAEAMMKLGLKTSESLKSAAKDAGDAYDFIKKAGQQEGESYVSWQARKEAAAKVMLQRLIEANNGVATEAVKTRAAMEGLTVEVDAAGRAFVKSMGDAERSTRGTTGAINEQIAAYGRLRTVASSAGNVDGSGMDSFRKNLSGAQGVTEQEVRDDPYGRSASQIASLKKQTGPVDASYVFELWSRFQAGQIAAGDLAGARNALRVAEENARLGGPGSVSFDGRTNDMVWIGRLQQIVSAAELASGLGGLESGSGSKKQTSSSSEPAAASAANQASPSASAQTAVPESSSHVVTINLGDSTTQVNVSSASDAQRLSQLLQQLALAARRSSV